MNIVFDKEEVREETILEILQEIIQDMIAKGDTNEEIQERVKRVSIKEIEAIRKQLEKGNK